jgi:hypothetical protein
MPAIGGEAVRDVLGEAERGRAGERDMILVVQDDELAETQMAG